MRVGIDLDGVGFKFEESLLRYLQTVEHKYSPALPTTRWTFYEDWGMSLEEFLVTCNAAADAGILFAGDVMDDFPAAVRHIRDRGNTIHIITDRSFGASPEVSQELTRRWLDQHNVPYDTLTFSRDKTCVPTDTFIDDRLENYDALERAGTYVCLVDRPWNQDPTRLRRRVKNIWEFATLLDSWVYTSRSV